MALGVTRGDIRGMVLRQGMTMMFVALAVGVAFALATGRLIGALLFGVSAADPITYTVVFGVLVAVAILACWIPANRASGVDPTEALRSD